MTAIGGAAAITGAASGIGRALAIELASRGCDLALADRDGRYEIFLASWQVASIDLTRGQTVSDVSEQPSAMSSV